MILYHGSSVEVKKPDLAHSRVNVDFGKAFYVTPIRQQALSWCMRFKRRNENGILSAYTFDENALSNLNVLKFESYSESWLDFILNCRKGQDATTYDLVIGGVANDKVFNTVELFFDGLIDKGEAINRLQYEKPNEQFAFRSNKALACLKFEGSEQL